MPKVSKKLKFGFVGLFCLGSVLVNTGYHTYSVEEADFKVITGKINDKNSFNTNYTRLNTLYEQVRDKVEQQSKTYKNTNYKQAASDLVIARTAMVNSKTANSSGDLKSSKIFIGKALASLKNAQLNLMPSRVVEARGLYLDAESIPVDKKEISKLVREIKNANFNMIYPEVFSRGYSIVENPVAEVSEPFKAAGFDVLEYLLKEAHQLGMEVHPWVWVFRVKSPLYGDSFLKKYPNLVARKERPVFEDREPLFLSPASPMSKALVVKLLKFIATKYQIDGMLLDYIRYDETMNYDILTKQYFRDYYLDKYNSKPPETIKNGDPVFNELQLWREDQVTQTVKMIKQELTALRPGIKIGVAIFRTVREGRLLKMQDWRLWSNNQLIRYICPMLYTDNTADLTAWLNSETDKWARNDYLYPSLGAHRFYSNDDIYPLAGLLNERHIPGFNIFSIIHFGRENLGELARGVFRKPAYSPHRGTFTAIKLILEDTSGWLKKLATTEKDLPSDHLKNIAYQFDILRGSLPDVNNYQDYAGVKEKLEKLKVTVDSYAKSGLPPLFIKEVKHPLDYCLSLLQVYTREVTTKGKVFNSTLPPLPLPQKKNQ